MCISVDKFIVNSLTSLLTAGRRYDARSNVGQQPARSDGSRPADNGCEREDLSIHLNRPLFQEGIAKNLPIDSMHQEKSRGDKCELYVKDRIDNFRSCVDGEQDDACDRIHVETHPHIWIHFSNVRQGYLASATQNPQGDQTANSRHHSHSESVKKENTRICEQRSRFAHPYREATLFYRRQKLHHKKGPYSTSDATIPK